MRQSGEPSVEEILNAIKQVMARDTAATVAGERPRAIAPSEPTEDADVLDLAAMKQLADSDEAPAGPESAPLMTDAASTTMRGSLDALAALSAEPRAAAVRPADSSLEAMVREALRPALAAWLDRNLPPLVERMVAAEIARIVGQRG